MFLFRFQLWCRLLNYSMYSGRWIYIVHSGVLSKKKKRRRNQFVICNGRMQTLSIQWRNGGYNIIFFFFYRSQFLVYTWQWKWAKAIRNQSHKWWEDSDALERQFTCVWFYHKWHAIHCQIIKLTFCADGTTKMAIFITIFFSNFLLLVHFHSTFTRLQRESEWAVSWEFDISELEYLWLNPLQVREDEKISTIIILVLWKQY